ncbi:ZIP family zinc transporter [Arthrobacter sp. TES]|uniref:ZIP family zinc transporter n=1 Tax=Paenarthrobacter ureafaciens TaxID=37931 RepID=A0AAX3EJ72_PAEUR|nr:MULTISPECIES: ZIP family zinc transporter [Paenarthrobacter]ERI36772.2 ZIP family zinc transporter [Arthrobacter sp. AK-YN10]NKR11976.1 ZIP family zinc transporter [Arthrobacter sp. M5]NKR16254.1 ZIP family zinc transporter [Arthrobacter sp. M6]OEH57491.1 ZIP family zinc transporter [Arthrobacter sp. D4]OEH58766.1 ZIP family zinc transporter [Arthrobacter sp. D2]QOI64995.1 ZIP family zinc transporter [Arthrobacter sp. TES]BCW86337.1 ZIP family zinc transporter [Arthrobacter sp. NicSoilE8]
MPMWMQALMWGTIAGGALVLGSALSWKWSIPPKIVSSVMSFGAGVLISALAFDLVDEAASGGGLWPTVFGFLAGAVVYVGANFLLARRGAKHRKRSGGHQPSEAESPGSGTAIAVGALLDGIPESVVLGLGLITGGGVSPAMLAAVFISNVPEGLSSTAGMKKSGRSAAYVFGVWGGIAVLCGIASLVGYSALENAPAGVIAFITATAAGAILAMLADTMIPEAFEEHHLLSGLIASLGFLTAFTISELGG